MKRRPLSAYAVAMMVIGGAVWLLLLWVAVDPQDTVGRAVLKMSTGLYTIWSLCFFLVIRRYRDGLVRVAERIPLRPGGIAFAIAVVLFLLEEVVTTTMTNLAPLFGSEIGVAYITGSSNYFEVILWHSGIALIPVIAVWCAWISVFRPDPNVAYLAFGTMGVLAEVLYGGPQHAVAFAFWIAVYGPILYLPAYFLHRKPARREFKVWHVPLLWVISMIAVTPSRIIVDQFRPDDAGFPEVIQQSQTDFGEANDGLLYSKHAGVA